MKQEYLITKADMELLLQYIQSDNYSDELVETVSQICYDFDIDHYELDDLLVDRVSAFRAWDSIQSCAVEHLYSEIDYYKQAWGV